MAPRARIRPSGRGRRAPRLEGGRLIETGLPALARRRGRLLGGGDAQRVAGLGTIEPGGNLQRRNALRVHVRLRLVTGVGPEQVAAAERQQQRGDPKDSPRRAHSAALILNALNLIRPLPFSIVAVSIALASLQLPTRLQPKAP